MAGRYSNIRMHTTPHNNIADDAMTTTNHTLLYDFYISPPPPPFSHFGGYPEGGWLRANVGTYANKTCRDGPYEANMPACSSYPQPDDTWTDNTIDGFSAACWHFAEQLTDYMEENNGARSPRDPRPTCQPPVFCESWCANSEVRAAH